MSYAWATGAGGYWPVMAHETGTSARRCELGAVLDPGGTVTRHGRTINVARQGLPTDSNIALMVRSGGVSHGHLLLTAATRVVRASQEQLRCA